MVKRAILFMLIIFLFLPLGPMSERGVAVKLENNLNLMVVRSGYYSNFVGALDRLGYSYIGDKNHDRYIENINGYGLADNYVKKKSIDSIFITVEKDSKAYKNGLRDKDLIYGIYLKNCEDKKYSIYRKWIDLFRCSSTVKINRGGENLFLNLPADGNRGAVGIQTLGNYNPKTIYQINNITGLSGGMALSLMYLDRMSDGSLFSKDRVSATGEVWPHINSYDKISSLDLKLKAAINDKSTVFFIPYNQNLDEIRGIKIPGSLTIYKIKSIDEAVRILCSRGSNDKLCLGLKR